MSEQRTAPQGNGSDVAIRNVDIPLDYTVLEHVIGTGDLSKLTTRQRVEYYGKTCEALGVNPLTRPFRFMSFQGQTVMYATRDLADQLRNLRNISLAVVDQKLDGDLFIVTVRATMPGGRNDEDMGAVTMGNLRGDARANAILKAITKAKRRVTLSICGLGFNDETEIETLPGAVTYDHDAEATPQTLPPKQQAKAPASKPATSQQDAPAYEWPSLQEPDGTKWLANFLRVADECTSTEEVTELAKHPTVSLALAKAPARVKRDIEEKLADAWARFEKTAPDGKSGPAWDDGSDAAEPGSLDEVLPPELRARPETPAE